jgi:hypothetical protein
MDHQPNVFRKLESPSAERNKGPIWEALAGRVLPPILDEVARVTSKDDVRRGSSRSSGGCNDNDGPNAPNGHNDATIRVLEIAAGAGGTLRWNKKWQGLTPRRPM